MKQILVYWVIGCLLAGAGIGAHKTRCPNDTEPTAAQVVAVVAVWPAAFTEVLVGDGKLSACERQP